MKIVILLIALIALGCEKRQPVELEAAFKPGDIVKTLLDGRRGIVVGNAESFGPTEWWQIRFASNSTNCEPYVTMNLNKAEFSKE